MVRRDSRIGIIGAGAAGLAAASALHDAGYRSVTVLEEQDRVGGKCFTVFDEGRAYELGAGALTPAYTAVLGLMRRHGVTAEQKWSGLQLDLEGGRHSYVPPPLRGLGWLRAAPQLVRLAGHMVKHRRLFRPGLAGVDPALHAPSSEWMIESGVDVLGATFQPFFTGFGYGYYEDVPALYPLKYATFAGPISEVLEVGYGGLWERVAESIDVRLETRVETVERSSDGVRLTTSGGDFDFDVLIAACALDRLLRCLDATDEERNLFSRIRYNPYCAVGAVVEGVPRARWLFTPSEYGAGQNGKPLFGYRRFEESDLVFFYSYIKSLEDTDSAVRGVGELVERLGGTVRETRFVQPWRYFPHVTRRDLDEGFFRRMEALQGQRSTYYVGEALAFGVVEACVRYSQALVDRFFDDRPRRPPFGIRG